MEYVFSYKKTSSSEMNFEYILRGGFYRPFKYTSKSILDIRTFRTAFFVSRRKLPIVSYKNVLVKRRKIELLSNNKPIRVNNNSLSVNSKNYAFSTSKVNNKDIKLNKSHIRIFNNTSSKDIRVENNLSLIPNYKSNRKYNFLNPLFVDNNSIEYMIEDTFKGLVERDSIGIKIDYSNHFLSKAVSGDIYIDKSNFTANNEKARINLFNKLLFLKGDNKKINISNKLTKLSKDIVHIAYQYENLFITKPTKNLSRFYIDIFSSKDILNLSYIYDDTFTSKDDKDVLINKDKIIGFYKDSKGIVKGSTFMNVQKLYKESFYDYNSIGFKKYDKDLSTSYYNVGVKNCNNKLTVFSGLKGYAKENNSLGRLYLNDFVTKDNKNLSILKTYKGYSKGYKNLGVNYNNILISNDGHKVMYYKNNGALNIDIEKKNLYKSYDDNDYKINSKDIESIKTDVSVSKEFKEVMFQYRDNFVTVIHHNGEDKPDWTYSNKIDELLLPQKDYKYSDFVKKLINEDGTLNYNYVKSYDAEKDEYTVTLPVEHPLKIYADIARDYLDLDTGIMDQVYYYITYIWNKNMFKYITMNAQESLINIMEYAYNQIEKHFKGLVNEKKQALRTLQLFRWFAEMAILNNCDYILKFNTEDVDVDYLNKSFNKLSNNISLSNFAFTDEGVIEPINKNETATITISNVNKNLLSKSKCNFKLYNSKCKIGILKDEEKEIYYNDDYIQLNIEFKNKLVINYYPTDDSNISVSDMKFSNIHSTNTFTVTYKGVFGESNRVMNDLLEQILVIGEIPDEVKVALSDVFPTTVAIEKLIHYFDIHHKDKEKGKRITIKK